MSRRFPFKLFALYKNLREYNCKNIEFTGSTAKCSFYVLLLCFCFCYHPSMKHTRTTYSPDLKLAVQMNALTPEMRRTIPSSTLAGFKSYDLSKVYGFDKSIDFLDRIEHCKELIKAKELQPVLKAYLRIKHILLSIGSKPGHGISRILSVKEKVVHCIISVKKHIKLEKVCRLFRISVSTFRS